MRLNVDYKDLDDLLEKYQDALPSDEKLTRVDVKIFKSIFFGLAEISNGGWTSVKEKPPEEKVWVLVWEKQGFAYADKLVNGVWQIGGNNGAIITHWQPLPEEPKEET